MRKVICFDDVLLEPKYSTISSRKTINLSTIISPRTDKRLTLPIISSPMDTVTGAEMVAAMATAGGLGILHRYNTIEAQAHLAREAANLGADLIGAAIPASGDYKERAAALREAGVNFFCIDIAHGHHLLMKESLEYVRRKFGDSVHVMAGNVATLEAFNDLSDWGADAVSGGVGGGSICSTRIQTGHGIPTLQSIIDCSSSDRDAALIADGGIKNSGDIVKALAAGADAVMCGSLLSGTNETPGDVITSTTGTSRKVYRGMASREAQKSWRNKVGSVEGVTATVPLKGPVAFVLRDLEWGIRSGLSYSGCSTIRDLQSKCSFILQTSAGAKESNTHILSAI